MDDLTRNIIGSAIEVHKILGPGLLESIYETALCYEMAMSKLNVQRQVKADVYYKDVLIQGQRIDIIVNNEVIVEIKSLRRIPEVATSQLLSYLRSTRLKRGLLINFGQNKLIDGIKRISL